MNQPIKEDTRSEPIVSGPWRGFYVYNSTQAKHWMDLTLAFQDGRVFGDGIDDIARFVISGKYDLNTNECYWTKQYIEKHSVFYKGFIEEKRIWGIWSIEEWNKGGFLVWPKKYGDMTRLYDSEKKEIEETNPAANISHQPKPKI